MFSLLKDNAQKNSIGALDGVRALACLGVIMFHLDLITKDMHAWSPSIGPIATAMAMAGGSGVTLFFVLSGFLLFMPYAKALLFGESWPSTRKFYFRRAWRIFPAYYLALFLMIALLSPQYLQPDHWKDLGLFLTFFMDSSQSTFRQLNGPFWTLAIEWQFYMLLPLLALALRWMAGRGSLRRRWWTLASCLIALMAWGVISRYWGGYYLAHPDQSMLVPRPVLNVALFFLYGVDGKFLEDFAVGMLISGCYVLAQRPDHEMHCLGEKVKRFSFWFWGAGVFVLFVMTLWHGNHSVRHSIPLFDPIFPVYDFYSELGLSIGFGLCLIAILFGPAILKRPFEWQPLRWIGLISYSLYIWHLPLLDHFSHHIGSFVASWPGPLVYGLFWLFVLVIVIPFAYALYKWVELPGIAFSHRKPTPREPAPRSSVPLEPRRREPLTRPL